MRRRDVLVTAAGYTKLARGTIDSLEYAGLVRFGPLPTSWDSYWLPVPAAL